MPTSLKQLEEARGGVTAIVGSMRNARMAVSKIGTTATFTADEVVVKSALGNRTWVVPGVNKTINISTTGLGGMDVGSPPSTGFLGIYLIYNPVTKVSGLLAVNATSVAAPEVYSGANMPAGFTASALVSVVPITTSMLSQFVQVDRTVETSSASVVNASNTVGSFIVRTSTSIPLNAKFITGAQQLSNATASTMQQIVSPSASVIGSQLVTAAIAAGGTLGLPYRVAITTPQTIYQSASSSAGTPQFSITIGGYEF